MIFFNTIQQDPRYRNWLVLLQEDKVFDWRKKIRRNSKNIEYHLKFADAKNDIFSFLLVLSLDSIRVLQKNISYGFEISKVHSANHWLELSFTGD